MMNLSHLPQLWKEMDVSVSFATKSIVRYEGSV